MHGGHEYYGYDAFADYADYVTCAYACEGDWTYASTHGWHNADIERQDYALVGPTHAHATPVG